MMTLNIPRNCTQEIAMPTSAETLISSRSIISYVSGWTTLFTGISWADVAQTFWWGLLGVVTGLICNWLYDIIKSKAAKRRKGVADNETSEISVLKSHQITILSVRSETTEINDNYKASVRQPKNDGREGSA
jgi:hypothetical protein